MTPPPLLRALGLGGALSLLARPALEALREAVRLGLDLGQLGLERRLGVLGQLRVHLLAQRRVREAERLLLLLQLEHAELPRLPAPPPRSGLG